MRTERDRKKARKKVRRKKLRYLRERLAKASDAAEREQLIAKIRRISRTAPIPEE